MAVNLKNLLSPYKFVPVYASRKDTSPDLLGPFSVEFHWTSFCNYACVHCSYGSRRKQAQQLSDDVIGQAIRDLADLGTKSVYLSGGGEPTLVRGWQRHVARMLAAGMEVALITNAVRVTEEDLDIVQRLNYIAVSVYSSDEGQYRDITSGNRYGAQFSLPAALHSRNGARPVVGARCVVNAINHRTVIDTYRKAIASGYDYIIFIPAVDYEGSNIGLRLQEMAALKEAITAARAELDFTRTNLDSILERDMRYYENSDYRSSFSRPPVRCAAVETRTNAFLNYDGGVYLCQPHIGKQEYCIGNINERRLTELWNAERHAAVIGKMNSDFSSGRCRNCRSIAFNKKADEYDRAGQPVSAAIEDVFL